MCDVNAGAEMIASVQSGADGNTVNLGIADVDQYVAGIDIDDDADLSSGVGYLTPASTASVPVFLGAADTLDLELQATSTAPTEGKIRIFAVLMDVSPIGNENTVHFAADGADEVEIGSTSLTFQNVWGRATCPLHYQDKVNGNFFIINK